jgi:hypothetical protein
MCLTDQEENAGGTLSATRQLSEWSSSWVGYRQPNLIFFLKRFIQI